MVTLFSKDYVKHKVLRHYIFARVTKTKKIVSKIFAKKMNHYPVYSSLQVYGMFRGFRRAWKFLALILGVSSKTYLKNVTDFKLFLCKNALCYKKRFPRMYPCKRISSYCKAMRYLQQCAILTNFIKYFRTMIYPFHRNRYRYLFQQCTH
jgi:hypothetical protein